MVLRPKDVGEKPARIGRPDWPPGSIIYRGGDEPNLLLLDVVASDDPESFDVLVVEPV